MSGLGVPDRVHALAGRWVKSDIAVDDNGLLRLQYEKALGICEGSWTEWGPTPFEGPAIHDENGSIVVVDDKVLLYSQGKRCCSTAKEKVDRPSCGLIHRQQVNVQRLNIFRMLSNKGTCQAGSTIRRLPLRSSESSKLVSGQLDEAALPGWPRSSKHSLARSPTRHRNRCYIYRA
jgi:hypothetical protein